MHKTHILAFISLTLYTYECKPKHIMIVLGFEHLNDIHFVLGLNASCMDSLRHSACI